MAETQAELAEELRKLNAQQLKIAKEQSDRFDAQTEAIRVLTEKLEAGELTEEVKAALAAVKETTQALDDTIPDAPPVEPPPTE